VSMLCGIFVFSKTTRHDHDLIGGCRYITFAITLMFSAYTKHLKIHKVDII
jgi:hypothetical protein